jgi:antitoxin ChpS
MHSVSLRKVGGSVMLAVPPTILDALQLRAGAKVGLTVDDGRLVIEPQPRPRYTLDELLAQCDASTEITDEDREWLDAPPVGRELL